MLRRAILALGYRADFSDGVVRDWRLREIARLSARYHGGRDRIGLAWLAEALSILEDSDVVCQIRHHDARNRRSEYVIDYSFTDVGKITAGYERWHEMRNRTQKIRRQRTAKRIKAGGLPSAAPVFLAPEMPEPEDEPGPEPEPLSLREQMLREGLIPPDSTHE